MQGLYNFIVKPKGDIYNNTKKIGDVDLILNNNLSEFKYINRNAIVVAVPKMIKTKIACLPPDELPPGKNFLIFS